MAKTCRGTKKGDTTREQNPVIYVGQYGDVTPSSDDDDTPKSSVFLPPCAATKSDGADRERESRVRQKVVSKRTVFWWNRTAASEQESEEGQRSGSVDGPPSTMVHQCLRSLFGCMKESSSDSAFQTQTGIEKPLSSSPEEAISNGGGLDTKRERWWKPSPLCELARACIHRSMAICSFVRSLSLWTDCSEHFSDIVHARNTAKVKQITSSKPCSPPSDPQDRIGVSRTSFVSISSDSAPADISWLSKTETIHHGVHQENAAEVDGAKSREESLFSRTGNACQLPHLSAASVEDPWALLTVHLSSTSSPLSPLSCPSVVGVASSFSSAPLKSSDRVNPPQAFDDDAPVSEIVTTPVRSFADSGVPCPSGNLLEPPGKQRHVDEQARGQRHGSWDAQGRSAHREVFPVKFFHRLCSRRMGRGRDRSPSDTSEEASASSETVSSPHHEESSPGGGPQGESQERMATERRELVYQESAKTRETEDSQVMSLRNPHFVSLEPDLLFTAGAPQLAPLTRHEDSSEMPENTSFDAVNREATISREPLLLDVDRSDSFCGERTTVGGAVRRREVRAKVLTTWFQSRHTRMLSFAALVSMLLLFAQFLSLPVCVFGGVFLMSAGALIGSFAYLIRVHGLAVAVSPRVAKMLEEERLLDLLYLQLSSGRHSFYISRLLALLFSNPTPEEALALLEGWHPLLVKALTTRGVVHAMPKSWKCVFYGTGVRSRRMDLQKRAVNSPMSLTEGDALEAAGGESQTENGDSGRIARAVDPWCTDAQAWSNENENETRISQQAIPIGYKGLNGGFEPLKTPYGGARLAHNPCVIDRGCSTALRPYSCFASPTLHVETHLQLRQQLPSCEAASALNMSFRQSDWTHARDGTSPLMGARAEEKGTKSPLRLSTATTQGPLSRLASRASNSELDPETEDDLFALLHLRPEDALPWSKELIPPPRPAHQFVPSFDAYYTGRDLKTSKLERQACEVVSQLGLRTGPRKKLFPPVAPVLVRLVVTRLMTSPGLRAVVERLKSRLLPVSVACAFLAALLRQRTVRKTYQRLPFGVFFWMLLSFYLFLVRAPGPPSWLLRLLRLRRRPSHLEPAFYRAVSPVPVEYRRGEQSKIGNGEDKERHMRGPNPLALTNPGILPFSSNVCCLPSNGIAPLTAESNAGDTCGNRLATAKDPHWEVCKEVTTQFLVEQFWPFTLQQTQEQCDGGKGDAEKR
ncbi:UNVERIFIED_CONTAM: transmembrane protein, putative [Hammondia hammondi]|eukprot:XP_008884591.1 transmembrane protein, putative [Hammondia hammondi]